MYIENLYCEENPIVQSWGDNKKNVPLNIRKVKVVDEDGNPKNIFLCDVVERVEVPLTVENIVKAAAVAKFGEDITTYVATNMYKVADPKIKSYQEFITKISDQAMALGYK